MPDVRISHEFDCDEATYWDKIFFDDEYNRALFHDTLKFPVWRVLEQTKSDAGLTRKIEIHPRVENVPAALKKLLGDKFGYVEVGTFDRPSGRYRFHVVPSALPEKTKIEGQMHLDKLGDKKIRRVVEVKVEVKVFAVGGMVEDKTIADMRASYDAAAAFTRTWIRDKAL